MSLQTGTLFSYPQAAYATAANLLTSIHAPASPSSGCGSKLPIDLIPGAASINITIDSPLSSPNATLQKRQYRIHLPENYSTSNDVAHPLLLTFNGQYQSTRSIENYTQFSLPSINPNAIAVYPEGIDNQFLGDPAAPNSSYVNDVQFVSDVLDDLESRLCVDTNRIYGAGFSNGGGITGLLACNGTVGGRFAALAGVAAAYYLDESLTEPLFGTGCGKDRENVTIPYLEIHGDVDKIIAYDGDNLPSPNTFPIPEFLGKIAKLNGCGTDVKSVGGLTGAESNQTQILNGGNVTRHAWTCDDLEDVVVHYKVKGLGHGWPSTTYFGGILDEYRNGPTTWNASAVIGDWFGRWSLKSSWDKRDNYHD
ncbi:Feruloyl esterase B [Pseudocercospora fuligena]|uniref:feruloyl esterase n=1 Tax=Pseudocercospora fuligena TaxID=685502 RepID=A0A8H6VHH0_9PEZI|nr:Feruloyl esterase B [Pseudocercospora fuligena]